MLYLDANKTAGEEARRQLHKNVVWWCNALQARLSNLHEWVRVSFGVPFIQRVCVCVEEFTCCLSTVKRFELELSNLLCQHFQQETQFNCVLQIQTSFNQSNPEKQFSALEGICGECQIVFNLFVTAVEMNSIKIRRFFFLFFFIGVKKAGRPTRTYIQQLFANSGCSPEDLPEAMNNRERWWERVRDICADSMTWWWIFPSFYSMLYIKSL